MLGFDSIRLAAVIALGAAGVAQAGLYTDNFDDFSPAPATLDGNAIAGTYASNSGIRLVDAQPGLFGSIQVPVLDPGQVVQSFTSTIGYATPNLQSDPSITNPDPRIRGTGLGLFFGQYATGQDFDRRGPIAGLGSTPAGPAANGLAIELDTIVDTSPAAFRIYVNDVLIATNAIHNPASNDIRSFVVAYTQTSPTGGLLSVTLNDNTVSPPAIFTNLAVNFVPELGDRFNIAGSTDNDVNRVWITDANLQTVVPEPTALAGLAALAGLGLRRRSR